MRFFIAVALSLASLLQVGSVAANERRPPRKSHAPGPALSRSTQFQKVEEALRVWTLPTRGLPFALAKTSPGRSQLARATARALSTPNAFPGTTTWVPVKLGHEADLSLVSRYTKAGLLRRAEDGKLYALFRNPQTTGTDPQHNRCLGVGSMLAKGTGVYQPATVSLAQEKAGAQVELYQDPAPTRT